MIEAQRDDGVCAYNPERHPVTVDDRMTTVDRAIWTLVWLAVTAAGFGTWSTWTRWPGAAWMAPLLVFAGIIGMASVWWLPAWSRLGRIAALFVAEVAWVLPQGGQLHAERYQASDAAAFTLQATRLLIHGHDPYLARLSAAGMLHPAANFWTYTADGGHVLQVSYPSGSFLLLAPFYAVGFHHALVDWSDVLAWAVSGLLLYFLLPFWLRWLAPTLLLTGIFTGLFASGGTDALFVPFVLLAAWKWDRFGQRGGGAARWLGPVALGIACAIKQTPWFAVPLFACCIALEARRCGRSPFRSTGSYLAVVGGVFLLFNVPFVIWDAHAWLHGVLLPFAEPLVADGQGLVTLALHGLTGGVVLPWLSVAALLTYLTLVLAVLMYYPAMKRVWPFLLSVVLLIPGRSFASYLVDLVPAALLAATTVAATAGPTSAAVAPPAPAPAPVSVSAWSRSRRWRRGAVLGVPLAATVATCLVAFTSAPLGLTVDGVNTADHHAVVVGITVTVRNDSSVPLRPHFFVDFGTSHPDGFWTVRSHQGSWPIVPGGRTTIALHAPSFLWSPGFHTSWLAEAYTTGPTALSTSRLQRWNLQVPRT